MWIKLTSVDTVSDGVVYVQVENICAIGPTRALCKINDEFLYETNIVLGDSWIKVRESADQIFQKIAEAKQHDEVSRNAR